MTFLSLFGVCGERAGEWEREMEAKKRLKCFHYQGFRTHSREMWNERKKQILSCNIMCTILQYYVHNKLVSLHCRDFSSFAPSQKPLGAIAMVFIAYVLFSAWSQWVLRSFQVQCDGKINLRPLSCLRASHCDCQDFPHATCFLSI